MIHTVLERYGFAVRSASTPVEAEEILAADPGGVELLVTDVMLRGESGPEMAERMQAMRPGLRALFISGHSRDSLAERGIDVPADAFLEKPFTPSRLAAQARALLTASREAG
jgi:DNA-binding response OmpR family regulator